MKRVGYDADTGKYYFRDQDGTLWEGPEGAQYGELTKGESAFPLCNFFARAGNSITNCGNSFRKYCCRDE